MPMPMTMQMLLLMMTRRLTRMQGMTEGKAVQQQEEEAGHERAWQETESVAAVIKPV